MTTIIVIVNKANLYHSLHKIDCAETCNKVVTWAFCLTGFQRQNIQSPHLGLRDYDSVKQEESLKYAIYCSMNVFKWIYRLHILSM